MDKMKRCKKKEGKKYMVTDNDFQYDECNHSSSKRDANERGFSSCIS